MIAVPVFDVEALLQWADVDVPPSEDPDRFRLCGSNLATPYAVVFGLVVCSTAGWWPVMVFAAAAGTAIGWRRA